MVPYKTADKILIFILNRYKGDAHGGGVTPALGGTHPFDTPEHGDLFFFFSDINQHSDDGPDGNTASVSKLKSSFGDVHNVGNVFRWNA